MNEKKHNNAENESEVERNIVKVGSNQANRALMIVILVLLLVGGVYYLYFGSSPNEKNVEVLQKEETRQNVQELKGKLEQVPDNTAIYERIVTDLPSLPPISIPQIIPEVKQVKAEEKSKEAAPVSNIPIVLRKNFPDSSSMNGNLPVPFPAIAGGGYPRERRSAQMLVISGISKEDKSSIDINLSNTLVEPSVATRMRKLGFMITQGKIIDAVLETAISSDLQGMLRAVVSSNVYAETGNKILIPRGSRLIGSYSFDSNIGKVRMNINWNRIILPHGIDIAISSPGTDELGRAGVVGTVDHKISNTLFSSILLAGVSVGSGVTGQKASNLINALTLMDSVRSIAATEIDFYSVKDVIKLREKIPSEKWKLGLGAINRIKDAENEQSLLKTVKEEMAKALGIETDKVDLNLENVNQLLQQFLRKNKSVYEEVISKSIYDFSKEMRDIVERSADKKLTVYVDQGTALKVFVNQDIVFPSQAIF